MKIAKASDADLEMAMELASALEALSSCWGATMPEKIAKPQRDEDEAEGFSLANDEHCRRVCEYLIRLTRSASLFRVVWGAAVMLDPANKLVDPNADTIEHHPELGEAIAEIEHLRREAHAWSKACETATTKLYKLSTHHPRLEVRYWTGEYWEPLYGARFHDVLDALDLPPNADLSGRTRSA